MRMAYNPPPKSSKKEYAAWKEKWDRWDAWWAENVRKNEKRLAIMFPGRTPSFDERTGQRIPKPRPDLIDRERSDPNLGLRKPLPPGSQPQPNLGLGGGTMFTGGTPFFDERTGQGVFNPTLPIPRKPSMLNGMSWDGRSRGPESLLFQQGLIPNKMTGQFAAPATSNMGFGKGLGRSFYSGVIA